MHLTYQKCDSASDGDRPSLTELPFYAMLPSALTPPADGGHIFRSLAGARIIRIGTTDPGLVEGGGLIIDYQHPGRPVERLLLAFSERGVWVEGQISFQA